MGKNRMGIVRILKGRISVCCLRGILVGVAILSLTCGEKQEESPHLEQYSLRKITRPLRKIPIRLGDVSITAEVCDIPQSRQRGLMFRNYLPENEGMLFVFDIEGHHSFWMKNTSIPLSIAFIVRKGEIVQIEDMEPQDPTLHTSAYPVLYALEMNQGWFRKNGIEIGDKIKFNLQLR
ncbi:MAG: DUF192 domain-containing protein [Candidatus Latescibacteria bacterium]|nr:DUF192 domain-containing protein [Candidatus Latescibacterota bacterium]